MAHVSIEFDTDNDAFVSDRDGGIGYVLRQALAGITGDEVFGHLRDSNGNTVGTFTVTGA